VLMRTRRLNRLLIVVNRLLIVAVLLIPKTPLYAQRQQQNAAKLKADARNVVGIIGGDKTKTQTYCQILDRGRQINQAVGEKEQKKARALAQEIVQLQKQLPEFVVLKNIAKQVDPNSPDGREITSIIQSLNQSCPE
jgi:hypothetical protein